MTLNVEPTPCSDVTVIWPFSWDMMRWQILNPRPFPYLFWFRLLGSVDLKYGVKIVSKSFSEIPIPESVTSIYRSISSGGAMLASLSLTWTEPLTFENLRALESKLIITCCMRKRSILRTIFLGSLTRLILTFKNSAYNFKMSTMFSIVWLIGWSSKLGMNRLLSSKFLSSRSFTCDNRIWLVL